MTQAPSAEDRIPVIVGVGEITDQPAEISAGREPMTLMADALKDAERDSGGRLLAGIQSLDIVNFLSWRYHDPAALLCERLGITPARAIYGPVGGETPIRYIHEAAKAIARGECQVAAICGAEAQGTATKAERAGIDMETARERVATLSGEELQQVTHQSAGLDAELAGGDTIVISATAVIIVLLLLILLTD